MKVQSFTPPQRILMGAGPSDIHPRVLAALSRPTIGHLDPEFIRLMDEVKEMLQASFFTENALTLPISAPGSAGMEAAFANLLEPGDKVVVCVNGVFGQRMAANAVRMGCEVALVEEEWGKAVDPQKVADTLARHQDAKVLAFVHAETSTGAASDAQTLCRLAGEHGCLSLVDAVTSWCGMPVLADDWQADVVYSGTQKCLSCVSGLSPITFSERARQAILERRHPIQSWFLDMQLVMGYWQEGEQRVYHHTAPINALFALHEALVMLLEEGLEQSWARHWAMHERLRDGLESLGLELMVEPATRLPMLNVVKIPEGVDDARVRSLMLEDFGLEISAGLGPMKGKIWRIGLMGNGCRPDHVDRCLEALSASLSKARR